MNQQDQIARIDRMQEETRKFVAEQHKLTQATTFEPWQLVITGMVVGAALFGAGAAFTKLLG